MKLSKCMKAGKYLIGLFLLSTVITLSSCNSYYTYIGKDNWIKHESSSVIMSGDLSQKTVYFLNENGMSETYEDNPQQIIQTLAEYINNPDNSHHSFRIQSNETLAVLIELCAYQAKNTSDEEAFKYWLTACFYSYKYLFDKSVANEKNHFDPMQYANIIRFYNYSLSCLEPYFFTRQKLFANPAEYKIVGGKIKFTQLQSDLEWPLTRFDSFMNCYDYIPQNLLSHSYVLGLGAPMLGLHEVKEGEKLNKELAFISYTYPFTFLLKFDRFDMKNGEVTATPMVFDSFKNEFTDIAGKAVPLSKDYSMAFVIRVDFYWQDSGFEFMLEPNDLGNRGGVYMLSPYNPNKIPVVFVHGLMATSSEWMEMINTLMCSRTIRENYQFWFYVYPSGDPLFYLSYKFRKAMQNLNDKFNPDGKNEKFNKMVIVGYSMGGLLAQMAIQSSEGDKFIEKLLDENPNDMNLTEKQRRFLNDIGVFEPLPFIKCVIFMATPHKGSEMATYFFARIGSFLISLPNNIVQDSQPIMKKSYWEPDHGDSVPNGIDELEPNDKFLILASDLPYSKNVQIHSIIGNDEKAGEKSGTDGVVSYPSAHLDNAISEIVIKSDHSMENNPHCIKEVMRILLEYQKKQSQ